MMRSVGAERDADAWTRATDGRMGRDKYAVDARARGRERVAKLFEKRLKARAGAEIGAAETRVSRSSDALDASDETIVGCGVARGRLDVMGGIADYSGAVVAQLGTRARCRATIRLRDARAGRGSFRVMTTDASGHVRVFERAFQEVFDGRRFESVKTREFFERAEESERWAAYAAGAMSEFFRAVLADEGDEGLETLRRWVRDDVAKMRDVEIEIWSDVPQGKGVASSAAVEVAVARATADCAVRAGAASMTSARFLAHVDMIPIYCWMAENDVVGAPCGFMDQYACFHSTETPTPGNFIAIDCDMTRTTAENAPSREYRFVALPKKLRVWGIDSGVRHSNSGGSDYAHVRCSTFMGKKALVNEINARWNEDFIAGAVSLCGVMSAQEWDFGGMASPGSWSQHVEEEMNGKLFLARYIRHDDEPHTSVDPEKTYALRACVSHALREHDRVTDFLDILDDWPSNASEEDARRLGRRLGELMLASHQSYSSVGLGSDATDELVRCVRDADIDREHLFGAKITGGGSGGVVAVLALNTPEAAAAIERARAAYARARGLDDLPGIVLGVHGDDAEA